jgi:CMP-N-acetylneuraminic acid synthetase
LSVLLLVPARGGSKGLPGKNLRTVDGVSLVGRAIRVACEFARRREAAGDYVHVDTDSPDIAQEAGLWGVEPLFLRSPLFARDDTSTVDSVLEALDRLSELGLHFSSVVLLQPTSPLRTVEDVIGAWNLYEERGAGLVVSVVRAEHPPEFSVRLTSAMQMAWAFDAISGNHRRQDFHAAYRPNGAVYVVSVDFLRRRRSFFVPEDALAFQMPASRSVDVDAPDDLVLAETMCRLHAVQCVSDFRSQRQGAPSLVAGFTADEDGLGEIASRLYQLGVWSFIANETDGPGIVRAISSLPASGMAPARLLVASNSELGADNAQMRQQPFVTIKEVDLQNAGAVLLRPGMTANVALLLMRNGPNLAARLNRAQLLLVGRASRIEAAIEVEAVGLRELVDLGRFASGLSRAFGLPVGLFLPRAFDVCGFRALMATDLPLLICDGRMLLNELERGGPV